MRYRVYPESLTNVSTSSVSMVGIVSGSERLATYCRSSSEHPDVAAHAANVMAVVMYMGRVLRRMCMSSCMWLPG